MIKKITFIFSILFVAFSSKGEVITPTPQESSAIWKSLQALALYENLEMVQESEKGKSITMDSIACVFEAYNACSFFVVIEGVRKFVVTMDGTATFMNALARAGVYVNEDSARMYMDRLLCVQSSKKIQNQIHIPLMNSNDLNINCFIDQQLD